MYGRSHQWYTRGRATCSWLSPLCRLLGSCRFVKGGWLSLSFDELPRRTEFVPRIRLDSVLAHLRSFDSYDRNPYEWRLVYKSLVEADRETIPACSFAELQRELPSLIHKHQLTIKSEVSKVIVGYSCREDWLYYVRNTNPADALIDLLVWLKGAGK